MCAHGCPDGCFDPDPVPEDEHPDWVVLTNEATPK